MRLQAGAGAGLLGVTQVDQVVVEHHPLPFVSALPEFSITLIYDYTVYLGRGLGLVMAYISRLQQQLY